MSRDDIQIIPRIEQPGNVGPLRRAREARGLGKAKQKRDGLLKRLRRARLLRRMAGARVPGRGRRISAAAVGAGARAAAKLGIKGASRLAGPVGAALLLYDAVSYAGGVVRRAEGGVSGRLLDAQDQNRIYGRMDELATGAQRGRGIIEGDETLLGIIGRQGGANAQITRLGDYFRERETARAIGADLIEREPGFDHLESIVDKTIDGAVTAIKFVADEAIDAVKEFFGGSTEPSGR